jgi:hypothetical protein
MNFLKTWLTANITPFLKAIKSAISTAKSEAIASAKTYTDDTAATTLQSAKSYTDTKLSQLDVLGEYKGSGATLADLNALAGKGKGDLAILTAKDGSNKPGIYVFNDVTSTFEFVIEIKSADAQALVDSVLLKIGDMSTLSTTEKTTLVGAINELVSSIGAETTRATAAESVLVSSIGAETARATAAEGDLNHLNTTEKGNLAGAINEVLAAIPNLTITNVAEGDAEMANTIESFINQNGASILQDYTVANNHKIINIGFFRHTINAIGLKLYDIYDKLSGKAEKAGSASQKFLVADAAAQTKEAVNASQFDFTITDAEAQTAWNNA